jgi:hypothetical protein
VSTGVVIAIVIAAGIVLFLLAAMVRRARAEREIERRRVVGEWGAHREAADTKRSRAKELGDKAQVHRKAAAKHATLADQHAEAAASHAEQARRAESEISDADAAAARHEEEAEKRKERL